MSNNGQRPVLRGRNTECEAIRQAMASARSGDSQVLVLRGEAGVGKTALLGYATELASGFRVTHVAGIESDMELAFAGLHQLCLPLMGLIDTLPEPQRDALSVAFGRGVGPPPDRFLVGLAVLSLLAAGAGDQPLLCVVDDAQWLDQVSVQVLGFVARRLLADPVVLLFGVRDASDVLAGLPDLDIGGLSDGDARALLESVMVGGIDAGVRDRVVAETRGNPLALLEIPRKYSAAELAGGFWNMGGRSSPNRLEEGFTQRIRGLPAQTQKLLLVAAAEPVGDSGLFLRAAAILGIAVDALAPAEAAGVIEFGPRMRFRHPLVRSATYRAADLADRREVHRALAEATDPASDPDRRAWHAATGATGQDDAIAAELAASAGRAQRRGGIAAAAAFLERATVLTSDAVLRGSRALAAAQAKRDAAAPAAAHELLAIAESGPLSDLQRAQVVRMRAQMEFVRSRSGAAGAPTLTESASRLHRAARQLEGVDTALARETYLEALAAAMYAGRLGDPATLTRIAEDGRAAVDRLGSPDRPIDFLLSGMTRRVLQGPSAGSDHLRLALERWNSQVQSDSDPPAHWPFPIAQESAAHELWDDAVLQHIAADMVKRARNAGALAVLPPALTYLAGINVYKGDFAAAAGLLEEAGAITASMGATPVKYHSLTVAAWRGVTADALSLIQSAAADGTARGEGRLVGLAGYTSAVLYNGVGRYDEALAAARSCCEYEDLGFYSWCLFELIEAAAHVGDRESAAVALPEFEARAGGSGTAWGLGAVAAAQALLAPHEEAEALFVEAIDHLERAGIGLHKARTHLTFGEWLRRSNRRRDAKRQLDTAYVMFTHMGAHGFAERTRRELVATGEKVRKQPVGAGEDLTARESQIARLAATGLTNQEIGAQLFISTHTVEWHLRKVFVKLGITSRRQLRTITWSG
ncbi:LuxR family transcriptional regulator [Mycobacterium sp. 236(2023)]|uniref:helix-turn-helix transcriptional regulator n=1 Tax=Mycobacterium sp. 236(2023) TaxID=3038163 RepID=UPI0024154AFB|nr:LuxR family transcriptional regulator [Mycobacterium sp. 236(2023)]MDG4669207.1 LuxR C-terminal-related transcriptional regulator [Mycobacterium sp. 236(2023)]